MTAKSVIDIDVNDEAFKEFNELFNKYKASLTKLPGAWGASSKSAAVLGKNLSQAAASLDRLASGSKNALTFQQQFAKATAATGKGMIAVAKTTATITKNISSATRALLRWAGITTALSGVIGAGGLFGFNRLAYSVGEGRRSAQGVGTTAGAQKAFGLNYGRFVDPSSFLANVNEAMQDNSKRWTLYAAGLNENQIRGKDTTEVAEALIPLLRDKFTKYGKNTQSAEAFGLTQFASVQDLNRLSAASPEDITKAQQGAQRDQAQLSVADDVQKRWQDFGIQLSRAGDNIETTFVKGLTPLIGPFTKLSDSVVRALNTTFANPNLPGYLDDIGKGIERFAKYINSPEAIDDVKAFITNIGKMAAALGRVADFLGIFAGDKPLTAENNKDSSSWINRFSSGINQFAADMGVNPYTDPNSPDAKFYQLEKARGLPFGILDRTWNEESSRGKKMLSPKGAQGHFGFMPATAKEYGLKDPNDLDTSADAASRKYANLFAMYKGQADVTDKAVAAYDWGEGHLNKVLADHPNDWKNYLPAETKKYMHDVGSSWNDRPEGSDEWKKAQQGNVTDWETSSTQALLAGRRQGLGGANNGPNVAAAPPGSPVRGLVTIQNQTGGSAVITTNQLAY